MNTAHSVAATGDPHRQGEKRKREEPSRHPQQKPPANSVTRDRIVEILANTANGCLSELGLHPNLRMNLIELEQQNAKWQQENLKLFQDNQRLVLTLKHRQAAMQALSTDDMDRIAHIENLQAENQRLKEESARMTTFHAELSKKYEKIVEDYKNAMAQAQQLSAEIHSLRMQNQRHVAIQKIVSASSLRPSQFMIPAPPINHDQVRSHATSIPLTPHKSSTSLRPEQSTDPIPVGATTSGTSSITDARDHQMPSPVGSSSQSQTIHAPFNQPLVQNPVHSHHENIAENVVPSNAHTPGHISHPAAHPRDDERDSTSDAQDSNLVQLHSQPDSRPRSGEHSSMQDSATGISSMRNPAQGYAPPSSSQFEKSFQPNTISPNDTYINGSDSKREQVQRAEPHAIVGTTTDPLTELESTQFDAHSPTMVDHEPTMVEMTFDSLESHGVASMDQVDQQPLQYLKPKLEQDLIHDDILAAEKNLMVPESICEAVMQVVEESDDDDEMVELGPDGLLLPKDCFPFFFEDIGSGTLVCKLCKIRYDQGMQEKPTDPFVNSPDDELEKHCVVEHPDAWNIARKGDDEEEV
ncbi:hypothetical protein D9613_005165 [Agrocybe pediades]|uniref:Uncharacterized protein n=1 Tax=Agrocybe pediades TaxID=84607 RepID=A0A8H4VRE3_9AGAR|nr:hypothetical protein D9613_005165 [Agrocybe pediades]